MLKIQTNRIYDLRDVNGRMLMLSKPKTICYTKRHTTNIAMIIGIEIGRCNPGAI